MKEKKSRYDPLPLGDFYEMFFEDAKLVSGDFDLR